jgi:AraC-like DNA-binding protein
MKYSLKTKLFELNIFDLVKTNYKLHTHENICLCAIKQGEMLFFHDAEELYLTPKKIMIFNANQPHFMKKHKNISGYHILHIYKDKRIFPKIIEEGSTCKAFFAFCDDTQKGIKSNFIENFLENYQIDKHNIASSDNFESIKKYIDENINTSISLEIIASKVNLNSSYISRGFKKKYGLSPSRYLTNMRVHRSKELLDKGGDITEIALELGFCDQAHFYKAFKSVFLITPNEYKQMRREE